MMGTGAAPATPAAAPVDDKKPEEKESPSAPSDDGLYRPSKVQVERVVKVRRTLGLQRLNLLSLLRTRDVSPSTFSGRDVHLPPGIYTDGKYMYAPHYDFRRGMASMRLLPSAPPAPAKGAVARAEKPPPKTLLSWLNEAGPKKAHRALEKVQNGAPDVVQEPLFADPEGSAATSENYQEERERRSALLRAPARFERRVVTVGRKTEANAAAPKAKAKAKAASP
uniref:Uncharacterized protein n=1 Tax=Corethron hystrix TaxID=216773 RepID=A0A7S1BTK6_9STRA|mmetsp:Transcript_38391/g.89251  ORF Transcript_38391/g.89251 Transcript_38391/m.89251 type:complete len:224 (+) Transcript_38391:208-879(+)